MHTLVHWAIQNYIQRRLDQCALPSGPSVVSRFFFPFCLFLKLLGLLLDLKVTISSDASGREPENLETDPVFTLKSFHNLNVQLLPCGLLLKAIF